MKSTLDFEQWLGWIDHEGNDLYWLHNAVYYLEDTGTFNCWQDEKIEGRYHVTAPHLTEELVLATEKARQAFLRYVEVEYAGEDFDVESQYSFNMAMEKND